MRRGGGASWWGAVEKRARVCVFQTQSAWFSLANKEKLSRGTRLPHLFLPHCSPSFNSPFLGLSSPCCTLFLSFMISASHICTSSSQWKINSMQRTSACNGACPWLKDTWAHTAHSGLSEGHTRTQQKFKNTRTAFAQGQNYCCTLLNYHYNLPFLMLCSICVSNPGSHSNV